MRTSSTGASSTWIIDDVQDWRLAGRVSVGIDLSAPPFVVFLAPGPSHPWAPPGATIPAPEPFPPGPLRWTARRLDLDERKELTR